MNDVIGQSAGLVWSFLAENGESSLSKVAAGTGLGKNELQRAIGWLAREDKLVITLKGRTETLSLA